MASDFLHGEVLVGFATSLAAIAIHAVMMALLMWTAHRASLLSRWADPLTATHHVDVGDRDVLVWGAVYDLLGAVPHRVDSFYFAFVNYTTLGAPHDLGPEWWSSCRRERAARSRVLGRARLSTS
jgi:hypothetical protein